MNVEIAAILGLGVTRLSVGIALAALILSGQRSLTEQQKALSDRMEAGQKALSDRMEAGQRALSDRMEAGQKALADRMDRVEDTIRSLSDRVARVEGALQVLLTQFTGSPDLPAASEEPGGVRSGKPVQS